MLTNDCQSKSSVDVSARRFFFSPFSRCPNFPANSFRIRFYAKSARNSFRMRIYAKHPGGGVPFHFLPNVPTSTSAFRMPLRSSQPHCFQVFADSLSLCKKSTPAESTVSRLFLQYTRGWGGAPVRSRQSFTWIKRRDPLASRTAEQRSDAICNFHRRGQQWRCARSLSNDESQTARTAISRVPSRCGGDPCLKP